MAEHRNNINNVKPLVQIEVGEHKPFNNIIETLTITSSDLEKEISDLFGTTFADFEGCKILPVGVPGQPETLKCKLYFKPCMNKEDEGIYAVKVRGENINPSEAKKFSLVDVVNTVNMLSTAKQFDLEEVAKEILSEFLVIKDAKIVDRFNADINRTVKVRLPRNWNAYIEEVTDVVNGTRFQNPYLAVTLDILPIIAKLYGKKDPEEVKEFAKKGYIPKDRYQYSINIVKILSPVTKSFIFEIKRIDIKEMDALTQSIGYGVQTGSIVMTRR